MPMSITHKVAILRILIGGLSLFLLIITLIVLLESASTPTDENIFVNAPSRLMLARTIPAHIVKTMTEGGQDLKVAPRADSLQAGGLIFAVSDKKIRSRAELLAKIMPGDTLLLVDVMYPGVPMSVRALVPLSAAFDQTLTEFPSALTVTSVAPGGASDRAGMKEGDIIVRVNGSFFKDDVDADRILREGQSGRVFTYEVYRNGELRILHVTLARFGIPLVFLIFFLTGLVYQGVGAFIVLKRPQIKAARLIGTAFLLLGFFLSVSTLRRDPSFDLMTVLRGVVMTAGLFFGAALAAISTFYFPRENPGILARRWVGPFLLTVAGLTTVAVLVANAYFQMRTNGNIIAAAGLAINLLTTIILHLIHRKQLTPEHRRLARPIRITGSIVGAVMLSFVFFGKNEWLGYASIILVAMPLSYLYTIGRYRLLDLEIRLRRKFQYILVSTAWGTLVAAGLVAAFVVLLSLPLDLPGIVFTGSSIEVRDRAPDPATRDLMKRAIVMVLGVAVWYVLWRIRKRGQQGIDHFYDRAQYDFRRALAELSEVLATRLSMVELGKGVARKVAELMHLKRAAILFLRDESVCCCQEAYGIENGAWQDFCLTMDPGTIETIRDFSGEFRVDYLPPAEKAFFRKHDFHHVVPIRSKEKLIGVLLLGEKLSESTFSDDDAAFLSAAALQSSVAIENAFLYEELAEQERLKHELEIARRIQLASLPQLTPFVPGLDIAGISAPAQEVGGDFFDYLDGTPDSVTVVVGDVSGKGTSAALYMSKVQGIFRSIHEMEPTPAGLFRRANGLLCRDLDSKSFVTAVGAAFDTSRQLFLLARAGHLPLYQFCAATQAVSKITPRGLGLGLNDEGLFAAELEELTIPYAPGDVLLFVTDGVTDGRDENTEEFGEDRLLEVIAGAAAGNAESIRDAIMQALHDFTGAMPQHDDQTIVVVKAQQG